MVTASYIGVFALGLIAGLLIGPRRQQQWRWSELSDEVKAEIINETRRNFDKTRAWQSGAGR